MTDIQNLYHRFQKAKGLRANWENIWQDCYTYALPQRGTMFQQQSNPVNSLFDATAPDSVDQLAALILSEMTPPWIRWFHLTTGKDLSPADRERIAPELDSISETMHLHFDRSNFALEIHQCYFDLITAGTACLLFEEAPIGSASAFKFTAIPLSEVYLAEGPTGRLDITFRESQLDYDSFRSRFPQVILSEKCISHALKEDFTFRIIESVIPARNGGYDYTAFLNPDSQHDSLNGMNPVLKEAHFACSPFISFRWLKAPGEVYGRSPVMKTLPDIKTANKVVELILKNASISVTGIWLAEDDGVLNPNNIQLVPGAIIPKAVGSKGLTPLEAPGKFDVSQLMIDDLRKHIRHSLLGDKLGEVESSKMTATEVLERSDEMIRILGATYGRLQTELLTPLIERASTILRKRGEIPEIFLDGRLLKIVYKSTRSERQSQIEADKALLWLSSILKLGEFGLQQINIPSFVKWLGQKLNVPEEAIKLSPAVGGNI